MARQGGWENRPWEKGEGSRDWDRWRRERESRRWEDEPSRERGPYLGREYLGGRGEEWRERDRGREEPRREWGGSEDYDTGRWYGAERGSTGMREPGWRREEERFGQYDWPSRHRPWVEPSPARRPGVETRGLVEWEDRGPLAWLHDKARDAARRMGRGPKGYTRSDERIHDEVCERIARSGVGADEVEVKVENREVTLSGTVTNREEKWWLETLADDVFGVEEVHNRLRVAREPGTRGEGTEEKTHLPH